MVHKVKDVSILGCGWFGLALAKRLIALGIEVKGSTTTPDKLALLAQENIRPYLIDFKLNEIESDSSFFDAAVLFICIPPKRNSTELMDYPDKIKAILSVAKGRSAQVVLISSTSVYSDENKTVNENSDTKPDTDSGKVVLEAEKIIKNVLPNQFTIIRFAGLIGPDRNPGRFFAGKKDIANGLAPVNLIHQDDAVGIAISILQKEAFGRIYNACSPSHPAKMDFYKKAAQESNLIVPEFLAEKKTWKIVESLNVPEYLSYQFEVKL